MAVLVTSFWGLMLVVLYSVFLTSRQATVDARLCQRFLDTRRKSGSVSCGVTAPFSWVQVHISSVLWKFCNQITLAFKVKFPGGSQSLCQIPRLGNLLLALELLQQCKNFFGITVLQFAICLLGGSVVGLTQQASQIRCSRSPCLRGRPLLTCASKEIGRSGSVSCGVPGSWCPQGFVWALWVSLAGMGFVYKCDFTLPTILLGLLLCPWTWGIFFWWDPTFSCQWLFSS